MFGRRKNKRKYQRTSTIDTIENKIKNCEDLRKNRMVIEFNEFKIFFCQINFYQKRNQYKMYDQVYVWKAANVCKTFFKKFNLFYS